MVDAGEIALGIIVVGVGLVVVFVIFGYIASILAQGWDH